MNGYLGQADGNLSLKGSLQNKEPRTHPEPNHQLELKAIAIKNNSLFCKQKQLKKR